MRHAIKVFVSFFAIELLVYWCWTLKKFGTLKWAGRAHSRDVCENVRVARVEKVLPCENVLLDDAYLNLMGSSIWKGGKRQGRSLISQALLGNVETV